MEACIFIFVLAALARLWPEAHLVGAIVKGYSELAAFPSEADVAQGKAS